MAFAFNNHSAGSHDNHSLPAGDLSAALSSDKMRPANRSATAQYQRNQVETASPTRLIIMLYDGAIRFCYMADEALKKRDLEAQNLNLIRAQRIVGELLGSLNKEAGGEVASNLFRIYTHVLEQLVKANLYDDSVMLHSAITALRELRESWVEIDRLTAQEMDTASATGPGIAPLEMPKVKTGATSLQNTLAAKTSRMLEAQRTAGGMGAASRLGDRNA